MSRRFRENLGAPFVVFGADKNLQFTGEYRVPKDGGILCKLDTSASGRKSFFVGDAKRITIRYQVLTGVLPATAVLEFLQNPDASFRVIVGNKSLAIQPGRRVTDTALNVASAINSSPLRVNATVRGETVTLTTQDLGEQMNEENSVVMVHPNVNSDGTLRVTGQLLFSEGRSKNTVNFNVFGRATDEETVGSGISLFDTDSSTGRTGTNVLYSFDESIVKNFSVLTASWSGLTRGDAVTIYIKREF